MGYKEQNSQMHKELERFVSLVANVRTKYTRLMNKGELNDQELEELGEIEYFLISALSRLDDFKAILEQDVFGHSLQLYNDLKSRASLGDIQAERKLNRLRETFHESIFSGGVVHWN
jgi:hypothetical protein